MEMAVLLRDKVCIVTGAASLRGIGYATAELFAERGAAVVVADVNETGEELVAAVTAAGGQATFVRGDVSVEADGSVSAAPPSGHGD